MNKIVKLPLFLGICGASCALILAGVNAFTSPIIAKNALDKANQAIFEAYKEYNITSDNIFRDQEISNDLASVGVTSKILVSADKLDGMVYVCNASGGYGGNIEFQVAFANGSIVGYTDIKNSETGTLGGKVISNLPTYLVENGSRTSNPIGSDISAGATLTRTAINNALNVIIADYNKGR